MQGQTTSEKSCRTVVVVWISLCKAWYNFSKQALCFLTLWPILLLYNVLSSLLILLEGKANYIIICETTIIIATVLTTTTKMGWQGVHPTAIINVRDDSRVWVITTASDFHRIIIGWHGDYTLQLYYNSCQLTELAPKHNSWDKDFYSCHKHKYRQTHTVSSL